MNTNIFVPSKINVGFQNRQGTYTGKLAYVIYFDEKGKLRKQASWDGWRDANIPNEIYDNEPTEGFVLNKKVGGVEESWGWDVRKTYTRIYDPRGFEFEITVPNLLWILENCNCIKGKGLEGQFVYGWDGKELVLVPVESPDYKEIQEKNDKKADEESELDIEQKKQDLEKGKLDMELAEENAEFEQKQASMSLTSNKKESEKEPDKKTKGKSPAEEQKEKAKADKEETGYSRLEQKKHEKTRGSSKRSEKMSRAKNKKV